MCPPCFSPRPSRALRSSTALASAAQPPVRRVMPTSSAVFAGIFKRGVARRTDRAGRKARPFSLCCRGLFDYPHPSQLGFAKSQTPRCDTFPLQRLRREGERTFRMLMVALRNAALEIPGTAHSFPLPLWERTQNLALSGAYAELSA